MKLFDGVFRFILLHMPLIAGKIQTPSGLLIYLASRVDW